jgi:hypothetical protein
MICLADFDEVEHAAKWAFHNACLLNLAWEISEMDAKKVAISRAKAFNSLFLRFIPLKNWGQRFLRPTWRNISSTHVVMSPTRRLSIS